MELNLKKQAVSIFTIVFLFALFAVKSNASTNSDLLAQVSDEDSTSIPQDLDSSPSFEDDESSMPVAEEPAPKEISDEGMLED